MKTKLLLLSLTSLFMWICFASSGDDVHYEQLYEECFNNYQTLESQYWVATSEIWNLYETLSWLEYLTYNLYWVDDDITYSVPLTNDIYLPSGYRAFVDSGVVWISRLKSLEYANSINDESFNNWVVENFWQVFLFLMSSGLFLVFLYVIRRYFIWLKSIK